MPCQAGPSLSISSLASTSESIEPDSEFTSAPTKDVTMAFHRRQGWLEAFLIVDRPARHAQLAGKKRYDKN
jgi:hypothetical protein